jgi:membrane-associated phospholipid phosphatase/tRNA A-37 threonylcarbamoyl transferase component Bud32
MVAFVVVVALSLLVFTGELRGLAVAVTAVDDAVVEWLAGLDAPGLSATMEVLAALGSWAAITVLLWGLLLALLILRRWRHLLVVLSAWTLQGMIIQYVLAPLLRRPRPFEVVFRTDWSAWALPSEQMAALAVTLVGIFYALVPEGRWRQTGKWTAAAVIGLVAIARMHLGVEAPSDVVVGVGIGVTIPLLGFRWFAPNEAFPVTYRRGRAAHLDIGGARGQAIRRALEDQLGLRVEDVEPFGLAGSAGSTPLRIKIKDGPSTWLFGKLYARSHLRADRWYKLGRELLYRRLEDEKPFHTVRRLVQQEDYALHKLHLAGLPTPRPYGFVELTPEREYLLVTEFFDHATELGEADIDDRVVDHGLDLIRKLWDTGLAHRDIKPANLLVRHGHLLLIDVAFVQARPSPWRQAVDLANMMLCLALRSDPQLVYRRALRQFSVAEISEAFAAARGLALPSQLRRMLRDKGRDLHAEFLDLLPARPHPIRIQRWSARRVALLMLRRSPRGSPAASAAATTQREPSAPTWDSSGGGPTRPSSSTPARSGSSPRCALPEHVRGRSAAVSRGRSAAARAMLAWEPSDISGCSFGARRTARSAVELEDVAVLDGVVRADLASFDAVTPEAGVAKPGCKLFVNELGDVVHRLFSPDGERSGQVGRAAGHLGVDPDHADVLEQERPDLVETMPADD